MLNAFGLGVLAQSSLLLAGLLVCWVTVPRRIVGVLAGFGAGAMLAAISFDLIAETKGLEQWELGLWMLVGVAVFLLGDRIVEKRFGSEGAGGAMGIVVGSVVDGVPESVIFGVQLATGLPISVSFIAAVMISNVPQAIAPSADLRAAGWGAGRLGRLWGLVVLACGVAAALGYGAANASSEVDGTRMAALAAGGLLAMLTNSLMPSPTNAADSWPG
jgi:ZIP family zinc transporter